MTGGPATAPGAPATAGEITLRDLLAWEPRLRAASSQSAALAAFAPLDRDVEWVVTARASDPPLPTLRGGELILLPSRIFAAMGRPLPLLLSELAGQPVAGIVVDVEPPATSVVPVLAIDAITSELEGELNRLLTTRRGELLRASAELERTIARASARDTPLGELVPLLAERLDLPLAIVTGAGATLITAGTTTGNSRSSLLTEADIEELPLGGGRTLRVGPMPPTQRALARSLAPRIRDVLSGAVARGLASRPVGPARAALVNRLLLDADEGRSAANAVRVGLPATGRFRVALAPPTAPVATVARLLGRAGEALDAGQVDGHAATVLVETVGSIETHSPELIPAGWLALSAAVEAPADLPTATRQARYLAALLTSGELRTPGPAAQSSVLSPQSLVVRFDDDARLGAFRLLYPLWGSAELAAYVDRLLGTLLAEDRRGLLRQTLRAYFETGGSPGATAERLGIHRNTLTYRLRQLRGLPSLDLDDPTARLGLHLALLAAALPAAPT